MHVRCERRPSKSDLSAFSCCMSISPPSFVPLSTSNLTSASLLGLGASSGFFVSFCLRLSLLEGRVGLSPSAALGVDRPAVGVPPRAVRELEAMDAAGCDVLGALEDAIDEDEVEGRAFAGGVSECRVSMVVVSVMMLHRRAKTMVK